MRTKYCWEGQYMLIEIRLPSSGSLSAMMPLPSLLVALFVRILWHHRR